MTILTQERALELFRYDPDTGKLYWRKRHGNEAGRASRGYRMVGVDSKSQMVHRVIWLMVYGVFPSRHLDHIDRNKANNKLNNLREATVEQNAHNSGIKSDNTSGVKGVSFDHARGLWLVRIRYEGYRKNIGRYETLNEAKQAYDNAALKKHGRFAYNLKEC